MIYQNQKITPIFEQLDYKALDKILLQPYAIVVKYKGRELMFHFNFISCKEYKRLIFEEVVFRNNSTAIRQQVSINNKKDCKKYIYNFINKYLISTYY